MPDALLREIIPQDLHAEPYLKDLIDKPQSAETFAAVFKKLHGAETLIGKRPNIPGADAKDEDWDKFLPTLRPSKAEDYVIPVKEGAKPDEAFIKELRESMMAGHINKRQAQLFLGDFLGRLDKRAVTITETQKKAQEKADAEFETLAKATLGEHNKVVMARVRKALDENTPDAVKPYLDKLDNNSLVIMTAVIDAVMKKHMSEDELNPAGTGAGDEGKSIREQAKALLQSKEAQDSFHPEHEKTKAKIRALYAEAAKAGAK